MENNTPNTSQLRTTCYRYIIGVILMILSFNTNAQIPLGVEVSIFPPYPTQYNVWLADASNYMITVVNNSDAEFDYYIRAGIEGSSGGEETYARISRDFFPSDYLTIGANQVVTLTSLDLEDLYTGADIADLDKSDNVPLDIDGELPEGTYQLCFELMLFDKNQEIFLSPKICSESFQVGHNTLQLVYPQDGSVWDAVDVPVTFQWINNSSQNLSGNFEYELSIYELDPNASQDESIYEYIESGGAPFFVSDMTEDLSYIYDVDFGLPEFADGNLYAARVKVFDAENGFFDGDNYSNINTFWFGHNPFDDGGGSGGEDEEPDCFERCQPEVPGNTTQSTSYSNLDNFTIGNFTVDGLELEDITDGLESIAGTGYVTFEWLNNIKIEVAFSGVVINTEGQAINGFVNGLVTEGTNRNIVDVIGGALDNFTAIDQDILAELSDVVSNAIVVNKILNEEEVDLPFGIAQQVGGQSFSLCIVGFEATPTGATMDVVNLLDFPGLGDGFRLGLGASDICVAPDGPGNEFKIHLLDDAPLQLDGDMVVTFKGGQSIEGTNYDIKTNQSPCYVEMSCDGLKALNISGIVDFSQDLIRKEVDGLLIEGENARGYFSSTYERDYSELSLIHDPIPRTDFILDMVMDDFQLAKLKDWTFRINNMSFDLSEIANPSGFEFPEGYVNNDYAEELLWKGFYIKNAEILTPKSFTDEGVRGSGAINHILIDNTFSMDVAAYELLSPELGSFKNWNLGIDTFELIILQNNIGHGKLAGLVSAPVMAEGEYLNFRAIIDNNSTETEDNYTFSAWVQPTENLDIPFAVGNVSICQNSYLAAKFTSEDAERQIELFLKGDIDIRIGEPAEIIGGSAYMRLADYQLHYNSVDGFISPENVEDGRGSYFGVNNNEELDCSNLEYTTVQNAFDYMMDRMIEKGETMISSIPVDPNDEQQESNSQWRDGENIEGLPIRFNKSNLTITEGEPILELIVEAQLTPQSITEAGIIIESGFQQEERNFKITPTNISFYYTEGGIVLNQPVDGSSLVTSEPVNVAWGANFQDQDILDDLRYDIMILQLDSIGQQDILDSLFRTTTNFFHHIEEIDGTSHSIPLASITPALQTGKQYAVRVKATHIGGDVLNNDGFTGINIFTWGQTAIVGTNDGNNSPCAARCSPEIPANNTVHANPTSLESFTIGNFTVEIEGTPEQQSGDLISGTGTVQIDFLNNVSLEVDFFDVKVNTDLEAVQGSVLGKESNPDLIDQVADYIVGNGSNTVISTLYEFLDEGRMVADIIMGESINLPFGINVNMATNDGTGETNSVNIAFTDFELTPTTSDIDFLFMLSLPSLGDGLNFGLGAQDICIAPDGFGAEARLYLPSDLDIPIDGETELKFNGGTTPIVHGSQTIDPFYLEIDCDGFKAVNISGSVVFPRSMLVKEDAITREILSNENVNGYFGMNLQRIGGDAYTDNPSDSRVDLILTYTMDPFQIKGLDGWGFEVTEAALDLSESENYSGMSFPDGYDFEDLPQTEFWTGFYLKSLKFKPPADYVDGEGYDQDALFYTVENLLIDPAFSATFTAQNLLQYENGNIKGWGVSIDSFGLTIVQNNFESGGMKGVMGAPVLAEEDRLLYRALIDRQEVEDGEQESYLFKAVVRPPSSGVSIPMMVANVDICASSYLGMQIGTGEDETHLELFLKSTLNVDFSSFEDIEIPGEFILTLADFQVQYNTVDGFVMENEAEEGKGTAIGLGLGIGDSCDSDPFFPDFDGMVADYRSGGGGDTDRSIAGEGLEESEGAEGEDSSDPMENAMNGFPVRLGGFDLALDNGTPSVSFVVDIAFASGGEGFAAGAGLTIYTEKVQNSEGKDKIKFKNVGFDCARLAVDFKVVSLLACLCYDEVEMETADGGIATLEGYAGRIMVNAMDQVFIDLQAGFMTYQEDGATLFGEYDYHSVWYIDGTFASDSGIPMGPLRLNAIGGGIYWNIAPPLLPGQDDLSDSTGEEPTETAMDAVGECIADLAAKYNINMPNGGVPLDNPPRYTAPSGNGADAGGSNGTFGLRTIKLNAGLSFADPKLLAFDPMVQVTWTAGEGIDEITAGGYMYFVQDGYLARGGSAQPPKEDDEGGPALENDAKTSNDEGGGSKLWLAAFNSIYFDRKTDGRTLVAFQGYGGLYLNIIPDLLYGSANENDPYKMISHDIVFTHKDHRRANSLSNGVASSIGGDIYWHAYLGSPYHPKLGRGKLSFDLAGATGADTDDSSEPTGVAADVSVTAYAMLGHGIPTELPPPPQFILDIIEGKETSSGEEDGSSYDGEAISVEENERDELNDVSSGFAFGVSVGVNVNFEKVIYANLQVVLGMDLLFLNVAGMQCITPKGNIYDPPGISNFYGMGQVFAGIKGKIGVKGKILGKEVEAEFLDLAAAMMIQAGGPNPFWLDGRAAVSYSVLGGVVKGSARVEVELGDICYPYTADPFSLDVISKVYPNEGHTGDNAIDPYSHPKVTFKMAVGEARNPEAVKMSIPEVDPNGNTAIRTIAPVLESFDLHRSHNSPSYSNKQTGEVIFSNTKRSVRFNPTDIMAEDDQQTTNRNYTIKMVIKAMEKVDSSWSYIPEFRKDTLVQFEAGPMPPYEKKVTHTNPIRGQRYFMDGEWTGIANQVGSDLGVSQVKTGFIKFYDDIRVTRLYATDNRGNTCHYEVVWRDGDSGDEISRYRLTDSDISFNYPDHSSVKFPIPALDPSTVYVTQLIRKKERNGIPILSGTIQIELGSSLSAGVKQQYDVENDYTIEYPEDDDNQYAAIEGDETLLHLIVFRTSRYDNLNEKLEASDVNIITCGTEVTDNGGYASCLAYDFIQVDPSGETFEEAEFIGHFENVNVGGGTALPPFYTKPRILVVEPFEGYYFDDHVKPRMNALLASVRSKIDNYYVGRNRHYPAASITETFNQYDYNYLNTSMYNSGNNNIYGNMSVLLDDFNEGSSYFASHISQSAASGLEAMLNNAHALGVINLNSTGTGSVQNLVKLKYDIRPDVRADITDLVNTIESKIDVIRNPESNYYQNWTASQIEDYLEPVYEAYNDVVNNEIMYNGNNSPITYGPVTFTATGSTNTLNQQITGTTFNNSYSGPPFRSSEIKFFYNVNRVDSNADLIKFGSEVSVEIDD